MRELRLEIELDNALSVPTSYQSDLKLGSHIRSSPIRFIVD